jgi:hypothetical protein
MRRQPKSSTPMCWHYTLLPRSGKGLWTSMLFALLSLLLLEMPLLVMAQRTPTTRNMCQVDLCTSSPGFLTGSCSRTTRLNTCPCRDGYIGTYCNQCRKRDMYNIGNITLSNVNNPDSIVFAECRACQCSTVGSLSTSCTDLAGECSCRPGFVGRECDRCAVGAGTFPDCHAPACLCTPGKTAEQAAAICQRYNQLLESGTNCSCLSSDCTGCNDGYFPNDIGQCVSCQCDSAGTESCTTTNGICLCRHGFSGETCNQCAEGYYGFPDCQGRLAEQNVGSITVSSIILAACLAALFFIRRKPGLSYRNNPLIRLVGIVAFFANFAFVIHLGSDIYLSSAYMLPIGLTLLFLVLLVNYVSTKYILKTECKSNLPFTVWLEANIPCYYLAIAMSTVAGAAQTLILASCIARRPCFIAPLRDETAQQLRAAGLIGTIIQSLSMIILGIIALTNLDRDKADSPTLMSIGLNISALLVMLVIDSSATSYIKDMFSNRPSSQFADVREISQPSTNDRTDPKSTQVYPTRPDMDRSLMIQMLKPQYATSDRHASASSSGTGTTGTIVANGGFYGHSSKPSYASQSSTSRSPSPLSPVVSALKHGRNEADPYSEPYALTNTKRLPMSPLRNNSDDTVIAVTEPKLGNLPSLLEQYDTYPARDSLGLNVEQKEDSSDTLPQQLIMSPVVPPPLYKYQLKNQKYKTSSSQIATNTAHKHNEDNDTPESSSATVSSPSSGEQTSEPSTPMSETAPIQSGTTKSQQRHMPGTQRRYRKKVHTSQLSSDALAVAAAIAAAQASQPMPSSNSSSSDSVPISVPQNDHYLGKYDQERQAKLADPTLPPTMSATPKSGQNMQSTSMDEDQLQDLALLQAKLHASINAQSSFIPQTPSTPLPDAAQQQGINMPSPPPPVASKLDSEEARRLHEQRRQQRRQQLEELKRQEAILIKKQEELRLQQLKLQEQQEKFARLRQAYRRSTYGMGDKSFGSQASSYVTTSSGSLTGIMSALSSSQFTTFLQEQDLEYSNIFNQQNNDQWTSSNHKSSS